MYPGDSVLLVPTAGRLGSKGGVMGALQRRRRLLEVADSFCGGAPAVPENYLEKY